MASRNSTLENLVGDNRSFFIREEVQKLENQRIGALQKLMNNVVQVRMKAKEKRNFLTAADLSRQIGENIRKRINRIYDGEKTDEIVQNILSKHLKDINIQIAFSNVRGDFNIVGTGFVYPTCKGDVLLTNYHLLSPDRHSYLTSYGKVIAETRIKSKEIFYNGKKVDLKELTILSEPNLDLVITRLPRNFNKETYRVGLARENELRLGSKVVKLGNTFGEGIQISSGIIGYNGTKEKIILGRKINVRLLSLPVAGGDSGGPVFSERNLRFVGTVVGMDPIKDGLSVPMRAYVLPWEQSIEELKKIAPYNECSYD